MKLFVVASAVLLFAGCAREPSGGKESKKIPAGEMPDGGGTGPKSCLALAKGDEVMARINTALAAPQGKTVSGFLTSLKSTVPALFEKPVVMYASKSLVKEATTPMTPRVITAHGDVILSSVHNPKEKGSHLLEMIHYDRARGAYDFYLAEFDAKGVAAPKMTKNPESCASCHAVKGGAPRPIWQAYNLWAGAYGGFDDGFEVPGVEGEVKERADFVKFCQSVARGPYALYFGNNPTIETCDEIRGESNADFTQVIVDQLAHRVTKLAAEKKRAMHRTLLGCGNGPSAEARQAALLEIRAEFALRAKEYTEANGLGAEARAALTDEAERFVTMNAGVAGDLGALGVAPETWLPGSQPGGAPSLSFASPGDAVAALRRALEEADPELARIGTLPLAEACKVEGPAEGAKNRPSHGPAAPELTCGS